MKTVVLIDDSWFFLFCFSSGIHSFSFGRIKIDLVLRITVKCRRATANEKKKSTRKIPL